jgi:GGDEF domain-containing protein
VASADARAANMISLKSFLSRNPDQDVDSAYRRIIDLFLHAISLHAVEGDKADYARFRSDMNSFAERLIPELSVSERYVVVGEAIRALEDYNRHTSKFLRIQTNELKNMLTMLTQTVIAVGASSEMSVGRLHDIEKSLDQTRMVEDIHVLKSQLGECLQSVRGEALRQKAQGKIALESMQHDLVQSQDRLGGLSISNVDEVTGLPDQLEAEKELQSAAASPDPKFLLLAVINRLQAITTRFGSSIGDQVLAAAARHFRSALPPEDRLYRWHGPVLVAVLRRTTAIDSVRNEVRRFADQKLEETVAIGTRSVSLPISASWTVFPIVPPLDALLRKLETFTAAQAPHEHL